MPLFEFVCRACGHRFESFVTSTRTPVCAGRGSKALEKLASTFGTRGSDGRAPAAARPFT